MKNFLFLSFTFLLHFSCAQAKFDHYSGNLLIKAKKGGVFFFCSSVAVDAKALLTAAHCLDNATEVIVLINNKQFSVEGHSKHPQYDRKKSFFNFDLGIIKLKEKLPAGISIYQYRKPRLGDRFFRVGFGGRKGLNKRQVIDDLAQIKIHKDYIQALDGNSVSGDSGGAIFQRTKAGLVVVGIHSTIDGGYSFNPSINSSSKWISSLIKK